MYNIYIYILYIYDIYVHILHAHLFEKYILYNIHAYLLGIQENKPYDIMYFPNMFHCFDQAWSIVEAGTMMGCASWCMDRFQRNQGCRPGSCVLMCILFGSC